MMFDNIKIVIYIDLEYFFNISDIVLEKQENKN